MPPLSPIDAPEAPAERPLALRGLTLQGRPLALGPGRQWTSVEELRRESPAALPASRPDVELPREVTRRGFLQLLGASTAAAGLEGCWRMPQGTIVPYHDRPVGVTPGEPTHYATTVLRDGLGVGLLVTAYEGRPTKIEGNPEHPASLGATSVYEQGLLRTLYDPLRAREVKERGVPRAPESFEGALRERIGRLLPKKGAGLWFLLEPSSSPLQAELWRRLLAALPEARLASWGPSSDAASHDGTRLAFGRPLAARLDLSKADVVVALDAELLADDVPAARAFADRRVPQGRMNRLYAVEPRLSVTGTMADHRLRLRPSEVGPFALALLAAVAKRAGGAPAELQSALHAQLGAAVAPGFVDAVAADLVLHRGASLVAAGRGQPPAVHAAAHAINALLGNLGVTVTLAEPVLLDPASGMGALAELIRAADAGKVDTLIAACDNPALFAPGDLDVVGSLGRVPFSAYLGAYEDETAQRTTWFVPRAHPMEGWGDARAFDGTASIAQPLLDPLFGGRSIEQLLARCTGELRPVHELLHDFWRTASPSADFELAWKEWLQRGVVPGTAAPAVAAAPDWASIARTLAAAPPAQSGRLEIAFYRDLRLLDGREAHNGWLQELPDPVTKQTWGNAALVGPTTADALGIQSGDVLLLELAGARARLPAYVLPGHADGAVSVALGYGGEDFAQGAPLPGTNVAPLRTVAAPWLSAGLTLTKSGEREELAVTQEHWRMEGRPLAESATLAEYRAGIPGRGTFPEQHGPQPSEYAPIPYPGYAWGMAIDLARCTGCSACVVACASENNTPVVGKEQLIRGREMHWLRLDRYFEGPAEDPSSIAMPVMCVQCEDAPCEYVCPVNATVHSDEGLNEMVYNRCVGTRYCSNNCPYKVRRFNFLDFGYEKDPIEQMLPNPDVTVRSRGVMEKCTYCVQRIERARIATRIEGRLIRDGEIQTACQGACPTRAIAFGTLSDPEAEVSRLHADPRAYFLLHVLGTRPRTAHLARIKNENPALRKA